MRVRATHVYVSALSRPHSCSTTERAPFLGRSPSFGHHASAELRLSSRGGRSLEALRCLRPGGGKAAHPPKRRNAVVDPAASASHRLTWTLAQRRRFLQGEIKHVRLLDHCGSITSALRLAHRNSGCISFSGSFWARVAINCVLATTIYAVCCRPFARRCSERLAQLNLRLPCPRALLEQKTQSTLPLEQRLRAPYTVEEQLKCVRDFADMVAPDQLPTMPCAVCQRLVPPAELRRDLPLDDCVISLCTIDPSQHRLHPTFIESHDGVRLALEQTAVRVLPGTAVSAATVVFDACTKCAAAIENERPLPATALLTLVCQPLSACQS